MIHVALLAVTVVGVKTLLRLATGAAGSDNSLNGLRRLHSLGKRIGHEINQLVREAIANAARHGHASEVVLVAAKADRALTLAIRDNGSGFGEAACGETVPRSMQERVHALGGTLKVESGASGSTVTIRLPWEWKR